MRKNQKIIFVSVIIKQEVIYFLKMSEIPTVSTDDCQVELVVNGRRTPFVSELIDFSAPVTILDFGHLIPLKYILKDGKNTRNVDVKLNVSRVELAAGYRCFDRGNRGADSCDSLRFLANDALLDGAFTQLDDELASKIGSGKYMATWFNDPDLPVEEAKNEQKEILKDDLWNCRLIAGCKCLNIDGSRVRRPEYAEVFTKGSICTVTIVISAVFIPVNSINASYVIKATHIRKIGEAEDEDEKMILSQ